MKTLAQIEPRFPISSAPFTITNPGSYYLTTNLTVSSGTAITIATNNITLDLSGYTISTTVLGQGGYGIAINSELRNIAILNGSIISGITNNAGSYSGMGFLSGIHALGTAPLNARVANVTVSGCATYGIMLGTADSTLVESCLVQTVGSYGIRASTVKSSVAGDCGYVGIEGYHVTDSRAVSGNGYGIYSTTLQNSYGFCNYGWGIYACQAQNCYGFTTYGSYGLFASAALNCFGAVVSGAISGTGLAADTTENCIAHGGGAGYGIYATTAQNSYGFSQAGTGLYATTAEGCVGDTDSGNYGLCAYSTAQTCRGHNASGLYGLSGSVCIGCVGEAPAGTGLYATIANSCRGTGTTAVSATYKYNMP